MGRRPRPAAFPLARGPQNLDGPTLHASHCQDRPRARTDTMPAGVREFSTAPFPIETGVLVSMIDLLPQGPGGQCPPDLAMHIPFLLQSCSCVPSCRAGWKRTASSNSLHGRRRVPVVH